MSNFSTEQILSFNTNGYLIVKAFCNKAETKRLFQKGLQESLPTDYELEKDSLPDKPLKVSFWDLANDDVLTNLTHSEKVVTRVSGLLQSDSPVCHIHAKFIEKPPHVGGTWTWHQDFAWWYANNLLFSDQVMSVAVALTTTSKITGCSKVLKGSHKIGRIDHGFGAGSKPAGADMVMVNKALESMELVDIEMEPGDAIFYHSNLLHRCDENLSNDSSWFMVSTYASQDNLATNDTLAAWHQPIEVVPNEAILASSTLFFSENKADSMEINEVFIGKEKNQVLLAS